MILDLVVIGATSFAISLSVGLCLGWLMLRTNGSSAGYPKTPLHMIPLALGWMSWEKGTTKK